MAEPISPDADLRMWAIEQAIAINSSDRTVFELAEVLIEWVKRG